MNSKKYIYKLKGKRLIWYAYKRNPIKEKQDFEKKFVEYMNGFGIYFD